MLSIFAGSCFASISEKISRWQAPNELHSANGSQRLDVLILGCGYTGQRVAKRVLATGARVMVTTRNPGRVADLGAEVVELRDLPGRLRPGVLVVHSIPPDGPAGLLDLLGDKPARLVYLSSTGVYGAAYAVDETTPADLRTERSRARVEVERSVMHGPWSSLILRPAAIYGPGRGAHEALRRGEYHASDNFVSRIHVDDLATHVEAGLMSTVTGAYPVADEESCTSREIAEFCARLLELPAPVPGQSRPAARGNSNRRVDGSAIRRELGITLAFPSYRVGIPAALAEAPLTARSPTPGRLS
jgi:nucleoside-diphosphate-sugar epimerase